SPGAVARRGLEHSQGGRDARRVLSRRDQTGDERDVMTSEARSRLGFIGIGLMGEAMVRRLLDRGWPVSVWNLEPERLATVVPHGAVAAASPAAVAEASDVVLLCVLHTDAVRDVVYRERGLAAATRGAKLFVDMSTIDPAATRTIAARLR